MFIIAMALAATIGASQSGGRIEVVQILTSCLQDQDRPLAEVGPVLSKHLDGLKSFSNGDLLSGAKLFLGQPEFGGSGQKGHDLGRWKREAVITQLNPYVFDVSKVPTRDLERFWSATAPPADWSGGRAIWPWSRAADGSLELKGVVAGYMGSRPEPLKELEYLVANCPRRLFGAQVKPG